jgi:hypothetical protein
MNSSSHSIIPETGVCYGVVCIAIALVACLLLSLARAATPQEELATQVPAARSILDGWQAQEPQRAERLVHLVYWTPSDREPAPRYRERLSKIFENVRDFYAGEMERNGFGPRTIRLAKEADGLCKIHLVQGAGPYASYGLESGRKIRGECVPVLRAAGIDPDKETIVIFCNMSNWDAEKRTMWQNSPYYASGSNRSGTAWQVDSPLLDLDLLTVREPLLQDGQYGRISPGRYNSIFIGGIIHELGHALGLPHDKERPDQAALWGTALMGSGNRTYGENLRGEGKGTFLTLSEAMRLASHPIFCGSVKGFDTKSNAQIEDIKIESQGKSFTVSGHVTAEPPAYAVIAATDPAGNSNYDATTATAVPDKDGRFTIECHALAPGKAAMLHLITAQANGAVTSFSSFGSEPQFAYCVEKDGTVDLTATFARDRLSRLIAALNSRKIEEAQSAQRELQNSNANPKLIPIACALVATLDAKTGPAPANAEGNACLLSTAATVQASVGWGRPISDRLPGDDPLLQAAGRLFAHGLYAHAPAQHVWALGGKWNRLTGSAGLAEGHHGTVVFSIVADGRELWHSKRMEIDDLATFDVSVKDVQQLEFKVSDAGDGNSNDWALWLDPLLERQ